MNLNEDYLDQYQNKMKGLKSLITQFENYRVKEFKFV